MQNTLVAVLGFASYAVAQANYGYGGSSSAASTTTYACNPAHSYPNGASCISTAGSLTLVTPTTSAPSSSATGNATKDACDAAANACRTAPNANQAYCSSQYAQCLGYNPYTTTASSSSSSFLICNAAAIARGDCTASAASVPSSYPTPTGNATAGNCEAQANACRTAPNANQAYCSSQYAACLGYNPYTAGASSASEYWTTAVVTSYTTYCPAPTTVVANNKTYTVTEATTLTITDCPCTITTPASKPIAPVSQSTVVPYASTINTPVGPIPTGGRSNATTSSIVPYTGAASKPMATGFAAILAVAAFL